MTSPKKPAPREVWFVEIDKDRPAAVVCVEDDESAPVTVVYGGKKPHPGAEHVEVKARSLEGKAMGLSFDTYFRYTGVAIVARDRFRKRIGECPYDLFLELETIEFNFSREKK